MFTKTFSELSQKDVAQAGGKGTNLGEMTQAKISVPPGFVVLTEAYKRFLEETDLKVEIEAVLNQLNHHDTNSIEKASQKIRDLLHDQAFPLDIAQEIKKAFKKLDSVYVAVRSSATAEDSSIASWAGELESYLNVKEENLLKAVKKCWSSLFTPRAIFYRFENNLQDKNVNVAVVIQKMIQSEVSGITFTVHPVTEDKNQMIIEAGWGLGEAIVSGAITPDSYVINKKTWSIIDINVNRQEKELVRDKKKKSTLWKNIPADKQKRQKLNEEEILQLAKICQKLEEHYQKPQDIEWAKDGNKFHIVQSRPITTL